jgi:ABC-type uncharacterized transport system permease subunit
VQVLGLLVKGAFGSRSGLSYTLYYATTFVFTGLAVAVAFHGGLFNIGGEGQAMLGGLGAALAALSLGGPPAGLGDAAADGAGGDALRARLGGRAGGAAGLAWQPCRHHDHHVQLPGRLADGLAAGRPAEGGRQHGAGEPRLRAPVPACRACTSCSADWGWTGPSTPLNLSLLLAIAAAVLVYLVLWRSQPGYALRAVGFSPEAARYAGIAPRVQIMRSMMLSGALAALVGINEIAGVQGRLLADFVAGAGFAGIAVSLIGRNHPLGIVLAALLFGALYQGGAELAFEIQGFSREMVFTLQGLIVLFAGAMAQVAAPSLARLHRWMTRTRTPEAARG